MTTSHASDDSPTADTGTERSDGTPSPEHPAQPVLVGEVEVGRHRLAGAEPRTFGGQDVAITSQGLVMPTLGFGTWQLDDGEASEMVAAALELGMRHIDTAQMYENEAAVGRGISDSSVERDDIFLTTKVSNEHHEPAAMVESVESSLEQLGTDHVDLLLIHWPVEWERIGATLDTLAQLQAGGRTDRIGVSNFTVEQLDEVHSMAPLEVLQVECHPFLQQTELRRWCADHDWLLTAYSPIAQGQVLDNDDLNAIAEAHDVSPIEITLAWLMALPHVSAIPRTSDPDHLESNWNARTIELSADEMERISAIDEGRRLIDPDFAPW